MEMDEHWVSFKISEHWRFLSKKKKMIWKILFNIIIVIVWKYTEAVVLGNCYQKSKRIRIWIKVVGMDMRGMIWEQYLRALWTAGCVGESKRENANDLNV